MSTLRCAVLPIDSSSIVSAISAAPCSRQSGTTRSSLSRPASRFTELTIARPGICSSAACITSGSVESIWIGASSDRETRLATRRHLHVLVLALGKRDAEVEHVRAALDLPLGDLEQPVVIVLEQHLLRPARALRVDALADDRRARVLDERGRADHRGDVRRSRLGPRADLVAGAALDDRGDVCGRGAAAAADDRDAVALDELAERVGERLGLLGEDRLAVGTLQRQAGVGDAVDGHGAELAEEPDGVAHVLGAGRAVEPDHVDLQRLERREHRGDVRAQQHLAAVGQQRHRGLDRQGLAGRLERLARAEDRGLHLEDVLRRLDDDEVGAAFDEAARLLLEDVDERAEGDVAERGVVGGGEESRRADRAGDEAVLARRLAGDLRGLGVDLERVLAEAPLVELDAAALEGVGLEHLGARVEHRRVHALDHVGTVQHERLVALSGQPAVVLGGEVELLKGGAHAAVEDDDAAGNGVEKVPHACV